MSSVPTRKKSIVSSAGFQMDTPVANNTLLNKSASQSTSLYQQCSSLRSRLMRIRNFPPFFALATHPDSRQSTDPVTQLWDLFSLGIPLCFIFNLLESVNKITTIDTNPDDFDTSNERGKKHAIALFAMQIRQVADCEPFTVTDLWDRNSTDGLVKVINTVTTIVDRLPESAFEVTLESDEPSTSAPASAQESARNNVIREMVETERKFVQDLETMQKYSNALAQSKTINQDTIHYLFPNLNKLLNFQRKFLIRLESTAELPWKDQRWGLHFIENEEEFVVYEPYCANYTTAAELMLSIEQHLMSLNHLINAKSELPAFLIKPIQRICKYPLLLDSLIKASSPTDYPHYEELKAGSAAAKRILIKINEAERRTENELTVKSLVGRIEDWKGHHLSNFGELLLDDIFVVTKSEVDREYHVFLFEKIILCCKEALPQPPNSGRKAGKTNSILKKQVGANLSSPGGQTKKKKTPLLLKGRIFLNNVTQAVPVSPRNSTASSIPSHYALAVWWRGDDDLEFFTLRCRTEEQLKQWETQINRLITEVAQRRASERGASRLALQMQNNTHSAIAARQMSAYAHDKTMSVTSDVYLVGNSSNGRHNRRISPHSSDEQVTLVSQNGSYGSGPQGYPPHDGFDFEPDDDEFEEYPPTSNYGSSGRGTPVGSRRSNALSMPPERDAVPGYDRPRAQTEDTNGHVMAQWRTNGLPPPPPTSALNGLPGSAIRSTTPHSMSASSHTSDPSFGTGVRPLRSQFSSTKLKSVHDNGDLRSRTPGPLLYANGLPVGNRSRSVSQPSAYMGKTGPAPPLPAPPPWSNRSGTVSKRGSGSSQSTGESSDYSPNSSSPITPFGSSESSLGGIGIRPSRSQNFDNVLNGGTHLHFHPPVKVKVHFHEDIFVIQVPRSTEYNELVEKVGRKIRLCGPRRDDGPLRVKYRDEDGDMVSLGSTEDVQMAFEHYRPGGQVILFVT